MGAEDKVLWQLPGNLLNYESSSDLGKITTFVFFFFKFSKLLLSLFVAIFRGQENGFLYK